MFLTIWLISVNSGVLWLVIIPGHDVGRRPPVGRSARGEIRLMLEGSGCQLEPFLGILLEVPSIRVLQGLSALIVVNTRA